MQRWEIGSDFDWSEKILMSSPSSYWMPSDYQLFSTTTASLLALKPLLQKQSQQKLRIHVPSFYCMSLVSKLKTAFEVCWYRDLPNTDSPDFNTLKPLAGEIVIAVNLFGIKKQQPWQVWQQQNQNTILIEDHTHDPFSNWAKSSTADYVVASLHKTLPIPDGGILWSPKNLPLAKPFGKESPGAYQRLTGMILKYSYLHGVEVNKNDYLQLSIDSQNILDDETNSVASIFTKNVLQFLDIEKYRQQRSSNISQFVKLHLQNPSLYWQPLFNNLELDIVPFNSIIICPNGEIRDSLRQYLIEHNIYPAIHWRQPYEGTSLGDTLAISWSEQILTIPTDQRYNSADIFRIFEIINNFVG